MRGREWPYVVEIEGHKGAVLYYGSWHTNDPDDPQIADMTEKWTAFGPTVMVTENTGGFHLPGARRRIKSLGEFGHAIDLAKQGQVPLWTLEPTWDQEIAQVLEEYSAEEATVFYTLRVFLSERPPDARLDQIESLARKLLKKRGARPGLNRTVTTLEHMDQVWKNQLGEPSDWRRADPSSVWPKDDGSRIQQLSARVNQVRDRHAAQIILDLVNQGERVFAVAGGSHTVKQEPVLRAGIK